MKKTRPAKFCPYLCERVEHVVSIVQSLPLSVLILLPAASAPPLAPSQSTASQLPSRGPCSPSLAGGSQRQACTNTNPRRRRPRGLARGQRERRCNQSPQTYSAPRSPLAAVRDASQSGSKARFPGRPASRHRLSFSRETRGLPAVKGARELPCTLDLAACRESRHRTQRVLGRLCSPALFLPLFPAAEHTPRNALGYGAREKTLAVGRGSLVCEVCASFCICPPFF